MTAPRRRWFAFSMRTLFVMVTALAIPLGWVTYELNWIRARHQLLNDGLAEPTVFLFTLDAGLDTSRPQAPGLLWLFGEYGTYRLAINITEFDGTKPYEESKSWKRAAALYPESKLVFCPPDSYESDASDSADPPEDSPATQVDRP